MRGAGTAVTARLRCVALLRTVRGAALLQTVRGTRCPFCGGKGMPNAPATRRARRCTG